MSENFFTSLYRKISQHTKLTLSLLALFVGILLVSFGIHSKTSVPSNPSAPVPQSVDLSLSPHSDQRASPAAINPSTTRQPPTRSPQDCSLVVDYSLDNMTPKPGDTLHYSMTITNNGSGTCQNPSVSVYYSNTEDFSSSNPPPTSSNYYWKIKNLGSGQNSTISFSTIENNADGDQSNTQACATADNASDACITFSTPENTQAKKTAAVAQTTAASVAISQDQSVNVDSKEYGVWVWVPPNQMTVQYENSILAFAAANHINAMYVTIDAYLDIAALPDGPDKTAKEKDFSDSLEQFVILAHQKGIAVDAEAGWRNWAESDSISNAYAIIDYVKRFNATEQYPVRGFQYDVEPYLLPSYSTNQAALLSNFVGLIDNTITRLAGTSIRLSVVIPHFYDDQQAWTPAITYAGTTSHTFNELISVLNKRPGSAVIIMAYRNTATGNDSTVALSQVEMQEAASAGAKTWIIIAQETGNVDPSYVTFYGTSKSYFAQQVNSVISTFNQYPNFGGIAIDYIDPFMQLQ